MSKFVMSSLCCSRFRGAGSTCWAVVCGGLIVLSILVRLMMRAVEFNSTTNHSLLNDLIVEWTRAMKKPSS